MVVDKNVQQRTKNTPKKIERTFLIWSQIVGYHFPQSVAGDQLCCHATAMLDCIGVLGLCRNQQNTLLEVFSNGL